MKLDTDTVSVTTIVIIHTADINIRLEAIEKWSR